MRIELRQLFVLVLLLGFLGGAYFLGFKRLAAQRQYYVADIAVKQKALDNLAASAATVNELGKQLEELESTLGFFERRIPRQKDVEGVLDQVWNLAGKNQLLTRSVRPQRLETNGTCLEQPMEVVFAGDYRGLFGFLKDLEQLPRITRVSTLELKTTKDADAQRPMQAKLVVSIYYEPDAAK